MHHKEFERIHQIYKKNGCRFVCNLDKQTPNDTEKLDSLLFALGTHSLHDEIVNYHYTTERFPSLHHYQQPYTSGFTLTMDVTKM